MKAKADRIQSLYDSLLATLETLDVNKDISPETVTIYQPACEAFLDKTRIPKGLAIAGVLGLVLGLVVLMLLERVDDRMNSFTELQEYVRRRRAGPDSAREKGHPGWRHAVRATGRQTSSLCGILSQPAFVAALHGCDGHSARTPCW